MELGCCGSCRRHVRSSEERCPFCGASVDAGSAAPPSPRLTGRHRRVAQMAFGAGMLVTLTACPAYGAPPYDGWDAGVGLDAGADAAPRDAGGRRDSGSPVTGSMDSGREDSGPLVDAGDSSDAQAEDGGSATADAEVPADAD